MSTTHRPWYRMISMVLAIALVTAMLPVPAFAVKEDDVTETETEYLPAYIVFEEEGRRTADEKHFRMSDGSYAAVSYGEQVHYTDEAGEWRDIDNTLYLKEISGYSDSDSKEMYEAVNGAAIRRFVSVLEGDGVLFTVQSGEYGLTMSMIGNSRQSQPAEDGTEVTTPIEAEEDTAEEQADSTEETEAETDPVGEDNEAAEVPIEPEAPTETEPTETGPTDETGNNESAVNTEQTTGIRAVVINPEINELPVEELRMLPIGEQAELKKLSSTVIYENVWDGTSLVYRTEGLNVKENIVVSGPQDEYTYSFRLDLTGLVPYEQEDGSIVLYNEEDKAVYSIPTPYMEDSAGEYSDEVVYILSEDEDGWILTVSADENWINAEERMFPVTIDPTVYDEGYEGDGKIITSYIASKTPNTAPSDNKEHVRVGYYTDTYTAVGLVYINSLPSVPNGSVITDAYINLYQTMFTGATAYPKIYTSTIPSSVTEWTAESYLNSLTWTQFQSDVTYGTSTAVSERTAMDYATCTSSTMYDTYWNIASAAQKWYLEGSGNASISRLLVLDTAQTGTTNSRATFAGYYLGTGHKPQIIITYRNTVGVEDIYDCHTQDIGRAGTGYINDFTLETTVIVPVLSAPSEVLPFELDLVYNTYLSDTQFTGGGHINAQNYTTSQTGLGWKTSVQQSIVPKTITGNNSTSKKYLIYTDGDGTEHYFAQTNTSTVFEDEDGLGLKITKSSTATNPTYYTMTDKENNEWVFYHGYLTKYTDNHGNRLYYAYNGNDYSSSVNTWRPSSNTANKVTSVWRQNDGTNTAEKLVTLAYSSSYLTGITDRAGRVTSLTYSSGELTTITYPDSKTASYTYTSETGTDGLTYHYMTSAADNEQGYKISYTYYRTAAHIRLDAEEQVKTGSTWTVTSTFRCFKNEACYSRFRYAGADNTFDTSDDIVSRYRFDNWGRTVNIVDLDQTEEEILGVTAGRYTENEGTNKTNNRLTAAAANGILGVDRLLNTGLEHTTSLQNWWKLGPGNAVSATTSDTTTEVTPRTGNKMMKVYINSSGNEEAVCQTVYLSPGTYVFSGYVNTACAAGDLTAGGAYLSFRADNGGQLASSEKITYNTDNAMSDGWIRLEVSYTVTTGGRYILAAVVKNALSTVVCFDDLQLERVPDTGGITGTGTASSANLIQYGAFERYTAANGSPDNTECGTWWSYGSSDGNVSDLYRMRDAGYSFSLTPQVTGKSRVSQTVNINGSSNNTYLLSAWGYMAACHIGDGTGLTGNNSGNKRFFGMIAAVKYTDTSTLEYHYVSFNDDVELWQYASGVIVPKRADKTVETITVTLVSDYNVNRVWVDEVALIREPVQTYVYDSNGNTTAVNNSEGQVSTTYDSYQRLENYTAMNGVQYTLHYGSTTTRDPDTVSGGGVSTAYSYDSAGNVTSTIVRDTGNSLKQTSTASYDTNKNHTSQTTDTAGATTSYVYNTTKDTLTNVTNANGTTTTSTYYANNDRPKNTYISGAVNINTRYDSHGRVNHLVRKSYVEGSSIPTWQSYDFTYNDLGQTTKVKVGKVTGDTWSAPSTGTTLASYTYDSQNRLLRTTYPNGQYVVNGYDLYSRLITETYYTSSGTQVSQNCYVYNSEGDLAKQYVKKNGAVTETYSFEYDSLGRVIRSRENNGTTLVQHTEHMYDSAGRLSRQTYTLGGDMYTETYTYSGTDGTMTTATTDATSANNVGITTFSYTYDALKRPTRVTVKSNTTEKFSTRQTYVDRIGDSASTSNRIASFGYYNTSNTAMFKWTYEYDNLGNITSITDNVGNKTVGSYTYDVQNQLTQETYKYKNSSGNWVTVTGTYTYDSAGNILTSSGNGSSITYTYGNSKWQDKLTSIKVGNTTQSISYSGGNPTNWYNGGTYTSLTWEKGSQLTSLSHNSDTISYTYDMEGIRTSKAVGGVTHNYITQNGKVVQESYGNTVMQFVYDTNGNPFALRYTPDGGTTWSTYYYMLNAQGDVVAVTSGGLSVVASYTYDAWGRLVTSSGWMASINPLRYRGYYYDTETGFYYVQSRYYDPIVKRFINADSYASTGQGFLGYNMFAYCHNNPVNMIDIYGNQTIGVSLGLTFNFIIGASVSIGFAFDDKGNIKWQVSYSWHGINNTKSIGVMNLGIGLSTQYTNRDTIYKLEGPTTYIGGSMGSGFFIGTDLLFFPTTNGNRDGADGVQFTIGVGTGFDLHLVETETNFNIRRTSSGSSSYVLRAVGRNQFISMY